MLNRRVSRWRILLMVLTALLISVFLMADELDYEGIERRLVDNPDDVEALILLARIYQDKAVDGDVESLDKAEALLIRALDNSPDNAEALAWLGSIKLLRARDSWFPPSKLWYLNAGFRDLDRAVSLEPDNPLLRVIRAVSYISIPSTFMKRGTAIGDLEYVIILSDRLPGTVPDDLLAHAHYLLGDYYHDSNKMDKALFHLRKAAESAPDSKYGMKAAELMSQ
ncbi:MAG TPA: hypothetical protein DCE14_04645 [Kosmotogaceae bacterium]|nr:hypothetical protein [Kosmotogaceae bacterium]